MKKMVFGKEKRGLSPVIATTLLILIAVIIAVIILLWIRSYIGEKAEKDLGGGPIALENACKEVKFDADAKLEFENQRTNLKVHVGNNGNVPIYGIEVKKKGFASVSSVRAVNTRSPNLAIASGEDEDLELSDVNNVEIGNDLVIVPIVLGESKKAKKAYVCEEQYGVEVKVV
ncbi:MAG: archaellin/type IV pilin N-terminal domain-containing protein [Nanoarchaeota archaeon]